MGVLRKEEIYTIDDYIESIKGDITSGKYLKKVFENRQKPELCLL